MRTIKFRGQREDNGEWVYGAFYPIKDEDVSFIINNCKSIDFDNEDTTFNGYKVHKKSVGEFTGRHDKNGKELYEGDIIKAKTIDVIHPQDAWKIKEEYLTSSVYWDNHNCSFETDFNSFSLSDSEKFEIIGNIFENRIW